MAKRNHKPEPRSAKGFSPKTAQQFPYQRQLKVRSGAYYYQYGDFQPRHRHHACQPVPWVYIKGYWLNQAGFSIGTPLQASISKGRIVLTASSNT
ncbi:MAG: SymE family type I addiction module toxin [Pseudomonadales bacterium]